MIFAYIFFFITFNTISDQLERFFCVYDYKLKEVVMSGTSTVNGSSKFSEETENEIIKLAGLLDGEEWEAVMYYLKGLQSDVDDEVIKRIVAFSRNYNENNMAREKITF